MFAGSPKKKQLSPLQGSRSYWFDLPDIAPRKKRRNRLPILLGVGLVGMVVLLLMLAMLHASP